MTWYLVEGVVPVDDRAAEALACPGQNRALAEAESTHRYEAGMYKCLYDLWEKRASDYQTVILDAIAMIDDFDRHGSIETTVAQELRRKLGAPSKACGGLPDGVTHACKPLPAGEAAALFSGVREGK